GDLQMVVRAGDAAPGLPGLVLRSATASSGLVNPPRISPFGEYLFFQSTLYDTIAAASPPTTADTALFWGPVGSIILLAREGDAVPFLGTGETWGPFLGFSTQYNEINSSGRVLFGGQLLGGVTTTANDGIIVSGAPGNLTIVMREGDVFPGGEVVAPASGATQLSFTMQMNEGGQVLHAINFSTTIGTATVANDRALAVWTPGFGDTIIAREGQQAPGLAAGILFATSANGWTVNQGSACFGASGNTAITTPLFGGSVTVGVDDNAIYWGGIGGLNLVMRKGDACPGLPGVTFGVVGNTSLTCNDQGQCAFISTLAGAVTTTSDTSMWLGSNPTNLTLLAREGDAVPGMPGYTFENLNAGTNNPLLNNRGCVLFQVSVSNGTPKSVLLGYTPALGVITMLDAGETFTTSLGTAAWSGLSSQAGFNSGDGGQSMFNNNGDFCYRPGLAAPSTAAILRGHLGSNIAKPSSIPAAAGGTQSFVIDCGAARAFNLYVVLGTTSGTRPGFPSPLGPQTIPLNFDFWTQLSLDLANTTVYTNSLWFLDGAGKSSLASFTMPPAVPGAQGLTLHHAVVTLDINLVSTFVSEPSALKLY
ncbi:MAG: choice-of-anchor tandem repeat NxxGxxAF-containing protein, partial [Planctomycetota bacterium]